MGREPEFEDHSTRVTASSPISNPGYGEPWGESSSNEAYVLSGAPC